MAAVGSIWQNKGYLEKNICIVNKAQDTKSFKTRKDQKHGKYGKCKKLQWSQ